MRDSRWLHRGTCVGDLLVGCILYQAQSSSDVHQTAVKTLATALMFMDEEIAPDLISAFWYVTHREELISSKLSDNIWHQIVAQM